MTRRFKRKSGEKTKALSDPPLAGSIPARPRLLKIEKWGVDGMETIEPLLKDRNPLEEKVVEEFLRSHRLLMEMVMILQHPPTVLKESKEYEAGRDP